jgi:hypothetical protein
MGEIFKAPKNSVYNKIIYFDESVFCVKILDYHDLNKEILTLHKSLLLVIN